MSYRCGKCGGQQTVVRNAAGGSTPARPTRVVVEHKLDRYDNVQIKREEDMCPQCAAVAALVDGVRVFGLAAKDAADNIKEFGATLAERMNY